MTATSETMHTAPASPRPAPAAETAVGASAVSVRTADGLRLAVACTGSGRAETNVIYVHGLLADQGFWDPLITRLGPKLHGYADQIAYDARGHGRSHIPARAATTDFAVLADDLSRVIDAVTGNVVLVAHSVGSMVALEYAARHRDQFTERVEETILFAAAGERPDWVALRRYFRPATACLRWMRGTALDGVNAAGHRYLDTRLRAMASRVTTGRSQMIPSIQPVDARVSADIGTALLRFRIDEEAAAALGGHRLIVVSARYDRVVPPEQSVRLVARIPGAELKLVADAGHSLPLTHPRTAARVVLAAVRRLQPLPDPGPIARPSR